MEFGIMYINIAGGYVRLQGTIDIKDDAVVIAGHGCYAKVPKSCVFIEEEEGTLVAHVSPVEPDGE